MIPWVRSFSDLTLADVPSVGGKNASLGEMCRELQAKGVAVPDGFATTAEAFREFLSRDGLGRRIVEVLDGLDHRDVGELERRGAAVRQLILASELPPELRAAVGAAYRRLSEASGEPATDVAVRSSATAEDLPEASFAGQQETFLNVRGESAVCDAVRRCFASLYTNRAIVYRREKGFTDVAVALSAGVQKMVRSDLGAAGVIFTLDTESGFRDVVLVTASWGLGESVVRGVVNPDEFCVFKPTLAAGFRPIVEKRLGSKEMKLVYESRGGTAGTRNVPVPEADRRRFSLSDDDVLELARWAVVAERHYSAKAGRPLPLDLEWAKDGVTGKLYILQARPETVHAPQRQSGLEIYRLEQRGELLVSGRAIGSRIGAGPARRIAGAAGMAEFRDGEVLVAEMTDPDWVPIMRRAAAVVTERGGRTCHAAIVSRELGIPSVVGAAGALERLPSGEPVTVVCAEGERGAVYRGRLEYSVERLSLDSLPRPRTKLMMNLADPELAFDLSFLPSDGVGLARMEFIVSNAIRIHPMALVRYPALADPKAVEAIAALTEGYEKKTEFFVDRLAQGVGKIAAAFHPKDVILRLSDFKTNEYAKLIGGAEFEPTEENPMLGFRGASRYDHPRYREGFALECAAIRRVRDDMGLVNLKIMVPFCRTLEEGERVIAVLQREGLRRGERGLELYVMCEIPSNVLLAREFAALFDGFSIGSNDLTQLILGVDRDSEIVAPLFDERNPAVLAMVRQAIEAARAAGRKIGICGQAPSDYPEFAEFLVRCGIDSISLNPDTVVATRRRIAVVEEARLEAAR
jgi:pyruvate,water dikinase